MKSLPPWAIPEIYQVSSSNPWLHFLDISFTGYDDLHLVRNTEDVTWNGTHYYAFPFDPDVYKETGSGEIPTRIIRVSNVLRLMEAEIEALGGAVGEEITWTTVNYKNIGTSTAADYVDFQVTFEIEACVANTQWVSFTLGSPFLNLQRFPLDIYMANYCPWLRVYSNSLLRSAFLGMECNYTGTLPKCKGTLEDCIAHGNNVNFGGMIGLISSSFKVA